MDRRAFVKNAGLVSTWLGISVVVQACSSDDDPAAPGGNTPGDVSGVVGSNHDHGVIITEAQVDAAGAVVLDMTGGTHGHQVALTATMVEDIGTGDQVATMSSNDSGHAHVVIFNLMV